MRWEPAARGVRNSMQRLDLSEMEFGRSVTAHFRLIHGDYAEFDTR